MIILDTTTRSLEIDLNAAVATNQLPFVASYVDINQSTFAMSAASTNTGASNSTTAVTLVAAPGATTSRQLKYLSIRNADTAAVLLWVQVNDNTTLREIWKGTLAVGDSLVYTDSLGFNVVDSSGGIKSSLVNTMSTLTLTSTLTLSGTAANIALGANFISYGGTDAGFSLDASNNATLSGNLELSVGALNVAAANATIGSGAVASQRTLTINGGSNSTTGANIVFKSANVTIGIIGTTAGIEGDASFDIGIFAESGGAVKIYSNGSATERLTVDTTGNTTLSGNLTTGTPNGGTAGAWKLGIYKTDGVGLVISTTNYVQLDIGGTLYKLGIVA